MFCFCHLDNYRGFKADVALMVVADANHDSVAKFWVSALVWQYMVGIFQFEHWILFGGFGRFIGHLVDLAE